MSRQSKKGQVGIKMCRDNGDPFITTLHNLILASDLCDRLFSIVMLMNPGRTFLFHKEFWTVYFWSKEKNAVTLPHSAQRKHAFWGEIKEMSKTNKLSSRKKVALELVQYRLGHRYTRSLLAVYNANFWEYVEIRIDLEPFCTSCQISSMNKKARSNDPLNPKSPFKWFLWT